jgi:hypothetical protein
MEHVYFTKDQFRQLLKAAKVKLKGRRGLSSKKFRQKLFSETLNKLLRMYISGQVVETEKEVIFVKRDENGNIRVNRKGIENG